MSTPPPGPPPPPPPPGPPPPEAGPPPQGSQRRPKLIGAAVAIAAVAVATLLDLLQGGVLVLPILLIPVALVLGTIAMISSRIRPYATGFLLTMGILLVVVGGLCVALISGLSNSGV